MNPEPDPSTQPLFLSVGECYASKNGGTPADCRHKLERTEYVAGSHVVAYATCRYDACKVTLTLSTPLEMLDLKEGDNWFNKIQNILEKRN